VLEIKALGSILSKFHSLAFYPFLLYLPLFAVINKGHGFLALCVSSLRR